MRKTLKGYRDMTVEMSKPFFMLSVLWEHKEGGVMVGNQVYASWQNSIFSSYPRWKIMLLINQNLIRKCMKAEFKRSQLENTEYRVREV